MNLTVYIKGDIIPEDLICQIKEFQSEKISDFFNDHYTFDVGIVTNDDGKVLGVGVIRVIDELKLQLAPELSNFVKAQVLDGLIKEAISRRHCGEVLAIITQGGEHYEKLLEKHFNFNKVNGTPLKWEI